MLPGVDCRWWERTQCPMYYFKSYLLKAIGYSVRDAPVTLCPDTSKLNYYFNLVKFSRHFEIIQIDFLSISGPGALHLQRHDCQVPEEDRGEQEDDSGHHGARNPGEEARET